MNQSNETKDLFAALVKTQSKIKGALKDSSNPFYKSKYADLESVWEACRGPLIDNGLCVIQTTDTDELGDYIVTTLGHSSGQWIRGKLRLTPVKQDPQAIGSAITYSRRYALAAIVGIIQVDDDGESAMNRQNGGIHPQQPTEEDGTVGHQSYRVPFGKYSQRSLEEVGVDNLRGYVNYLESKAKKDGKEITGVVAEFIERAVEFIAAFENSISEGKS